MALKDRKIEISVVIPVYGCSECLHELVRRLDNSLYNISEYWEIIMVNDASPDGAWDTIKAMALSDTRVKGINLSRNFGQHYAITAGLDNAKGTWIVVMDCDLQDKPEEIPRLYKKAQEGYDVVFGRRIKRQDNFLKRISSSLFYKVFDYFTGKTSDSTIANFGIFHAKVIDSWKKLKEKNRFFPLFIQWLGFKRTEINVKHANRYAGKTSYNFLKLFNLALDSIVAQSNKPLRISIKIGFSMSILSFFYALYLFVRHFFHKVPVEGWTSVMVSIYFLSGLILGNMGIIGLYIGKVFDESKKRPLYIISETINLD
jgi:dolichol-phosphate mannosyltransferase